MLIELLTASLDEDATDVEGSLGGELGAELTADVAGPVDDAVSPFDEPLLHADNPTRTPAANTDASNLLFTSVNPFESDKSRARRTSPTRGEGEFARGKPRTIDAGRSRPLRDVVASLAYMVRGMDLDELTQFLAKPRHDGWRVQDMEPVLVEPGRIVVRREVKTDVLNFGRTLHGGAAATLIDVIGSLALTLNDHHGRFGVSTDLNVTWLAPAAHGDWIQIDARVLKLGKTMGYVAVDIRREADDVLCVQGRMTKHMGDPPAG